MNVLCPLTLTLLILLLVIKRGIYTFGIHTHTSVEGYSIEVCVQYLPALQWRIT